MAAVANQALASGMGGVVCAGVTHKNLLGLCEPALQSKTICRPPSLLLLSKPSPPPPWVAKAMVASLEADMSWVGCTWTLNQILLCTA